VAQIPIQTPAGSQAQVDVHVAAGDPHPGYLSQTEGDGRYVLLADPPPASGGASRYDHTQTTPAATWTVAHSLNRYPNATALDTAQKRFWPDLQYPDLNTVVVTHAEPLAGSLHLS
jgi:hypothetical protein